MSLNASLMRGDKSGSSELNVENEIGHLSKIILEADGICLCSNWLGIDINGQNPNLGITVLIGNFYCDAVETFRACLNSPNPSLREAFWGKMS